MLRLLSPRFPRFIVATCIAWAPFRLNGGCASLNGKVRMIALHGLPRCSFLPVFTLYLLLLALSLMTPTQAAQAATGTVRPFDASNADGVVTVGPGGTYASLYEAGQAFGSIAGGAQANWDILILDDLQEPVNV